MVNGILILAFAACSLVAWSVFSGSFNLWGQYSSSFTRNADVKLSRLFIYTDPKKLLLIFMATLFLIPVVLFFLDVSPVLILILLVILYFIPRLIFNTLAKRRKRAITNALPSALQQIGGAMKAGATFSMAMQSMVEEQKGPIAQEFSLVLREHRLGTRLEEALDNLGERVQTEEMDLLISATLISQDVGGNLSEILARLSDTIRRKIEMEGKVQTLTSQGVLQGYVVTALPFFILGMLMYLEPDAIKPMFNSVLGWGFLLVIVCLQLFGGLMIKKIVTINV